MWIAGSRLRLNTRGKLRHPDWKDVDYELLMIRNPSSGHPEHARAFVRLPDGSRKYLNIANFKNMSKNGESAEWCATGVRQLDGDSVC
jgi:hypothetical protein